MLRRVAPTAGWRCARPTSCISRGVRPVGIRRAYRFDGNVNVPRGSRQGPARRGSRGSWRGGGMVRAHAMNRGQILSRRRDARRPSCAVHRAARFRARRAQRSGRCGRGFGLVRRVDRQAGQVIGGTNPVSGPYFNFTIPEPTASSAWWRRKSRRSSGLVRRVARRCAAATRLSCSLPKSNPLPALTLAEVLATSDLPGGVVNVISGFRKELLPGSLDMT